MRVLVTGAQGMLGSVLVPWLAEEHQVYGVDQKEFNIEEEAAVGRAFRDLRPKFVFHLAAFTDVDGCEANPLKAERVNALGTRNVARACAETGAGMLYVSSDYVFDGSGNRPYREDDCPNPLSAYGLSKFRGEQFVQAIVREHVIARSSWLYGPGGKNFVATIVKLVKERGKVCVVADQRGSPTYTRHLAVKLAELFVARQYGVFHVTGSGNCSWFEFAQAIVADCGYPRDSVAPITSLEFARPARRPAYSVLENHRLAEIKLASLPHWTEGLSQYLNECGTGAKAAIPQEALREREITRS